MQLYRNSNPPSLADLIVNFNKTDASDKRKRECSRNLLRTFLQHTSISKKREATSINDTSVNHLALFLLNANVLCASVNESYLSMKSSQSVTKQACTCVSGWRTSFNRPATRIVITDLIGT